MSFESFNKYVGIQGVMALMLTASYVYAVLNGLELPTEFYTTFGGVVGFYFAKNGVGIVAALRGNG